MKKVIAVNLNETVKVDDELELKAYYAGHVIGAAMFMVFLFLFLFYFLFFIFCF